MLTSRAGKPACPFTLLTSSLCFLNRLSSCAAFCTLTLTCLRNEHYASRTGIQACLPCKSRWSGFWGASSPRTVTLAGEQHCPSGYRRLFLRSSRCLNGGRSAPHSPAAARLRASFRHPTCFAEKPSAVVEAETLILSSPFNSSPGQGHGELVGSY